MFIKEVDIKNCRALKDFKLPEIAVPDGVNAGSGLNIILGENGCGKTSILDAIALGLCSYKVEGFSIHDLSDIEERADIVLKSDSQFNVKRLFRGDFQANGMKFCGYIRERSSGSLDKVVVFQNLLLSDAIEEGKPDLRADLKGTFGEPRYQQDYQIIDADFRVGSITSGTANKTEFDRFLEHLNYNYIKKAESKEDINSAINTELRKAEANTPYSDAVRNFNKLTGLNIELRHTRDGELFSNSFLADKVEEDKFIPVDRIGKGYQLLLALLVKKELAKRKKHNLILLLDEAEMHLHPSLQSLLIKELIDLSKTAQIFITSHSPIFVHDLFQEDKEDLSKKYLIKRNDRGTVSLVEVGETVLPRSTPAEINYLAFNYPALEYHNELYGYLSYLMGKSSPKKLDLKLDIDDKDKYDWKRDDKNQIVDRLSVHSVLRNAFHHKDNQLNSYCNDEFITNNLQSSIEFLRKNIKTEIPKCLESDND